MSDTNSNVPAVIEITESKLQLIKNTIAKDATDDELALFKYICEKRQLDPFARQIYAIKRRQWNNKRKDWDEIMTFQTGIDGFRLIAERTKKYVGQLGPFFTEDGVTWLDCWVKSTPPKAAKVAVLRKDFREPIWAMARFDAYCPRNDKNEPTGQWRTMPDGQIAKCAEALALRRAFAEELSGLYASEEMHQAIDVTATQSGELTEAETPRARVILEHDLPREARTMNENPNPHGSATAPDNFHDEIEGLRQEEAKEEEASLESENTSGGAPVADGAPTVEQVKSAFKMSPLAPAEKFRRIEAIAKDFQKIGGIDGLNAWQRTKVMEALQR